MTDIANATPAERLAAYRSKHLIDLQVEEHPDFGRIYRCAVDGLRVHSTRNGRFYHDPGELKNLLDAEYGGPWGTPKQVALVLRDAEQDRKERAIERIVSLYDPSEDDESEFLDDREGKPEFNGSFR